MSKRNSIKIGNAIITLGDTLTGTEKAAYDGHGNAGDTVTVHTIKERDSGSYLVGVTSDIPNGNWSNLDGAVAAGHGFFFRRRDLLNYFVPIATGRMTIKNPYTFRKLDLEGMECDILAFLPDGESVFVQFDKDVGGCASDGLGKAGHCLAVPKVILTKVNKPKNEKKKT